MAQVETMVDSIRVAAVSPERTVILQRKGEDSYLPFWINQSQAEILAAQLRGQLDKSVDLDLFLADINAAVSDIKCVTVHLENNTFCAKMLLSRRDKPREVKCPIGIALALACRAGAPILVDEALFDKAGVCFPPTPCEPRRKQSWWRLLFKSHQSLVS
jgi:bifunctional DNase/RNase